MYSSSSKKKFVLEQASIIQPKPGQLFITVKDSDFPDGLKVAIPAGTNNYGKIAEALIGKSKQQKLEAWEEIAKATGFEQKPFKMDSLKLNDSKNMEEVRDAKIRAMVMDDVKTWNAFHEFFLKNHVEKLPENPDLDLHKIQAFLKGKISLKELRTTTDQDAFNLFRQWIVARSRKLQVDEKSDQYKCSVVEKANWATASDVYKDKLKNTIQSEEVNELLQDVFDGCLWEDAFNGEQLREKSFEKITEKFITKEQLDEIVENGEIDCCDVLKENVNSLKRLELLSEVDKLLKEDDFHKAQGLISKYRKNGDELAARLVLAAGIGRLLNDLIEKRAVDYGIINQEELDALTNLDAKQKVFKKLEIPTITLEYDFPEDLKKGEQPRRWSEKPYTINANTEDEFSKSAKATSELARNVFKVYDGKIIALSSIKGGAGKTSLSLLLAEEDPRWAKIIVVDLNAIFGEVGQYGGCASPTMDNLLDKVLQNSPKPYSEEVMAEALRANICKSPRMKMDLLLAPTKPWDSRVFMSVDDYAAFFKIMFEELRKMYDYIFVDAPGFRDEFVMEKIVYPNADKIVGVVEPLKTSLALTAKFLREVTDVKLRDQATCTENMRNLAKEHHLNIPIEKFAFVLNRARQHYTVSREELEQVLLGCPILGELPARDNLFAHAVNSQNLSSVLDDNIFKTMLEKFAINLAVFVNRSK